MTIYIADIFSNIYEKNMWTNGSGPGSYRQLNGEYLLFLEEFIVNHDIKKIVDIGCGDFQLFKDFNFGDADYIGFDVVEDLIEKNNGRFSKKSVRFANMPERYDELPEADLYLVKDVLIHLPNDVSQSMIGNILDKTRFFLSVNNTSSDESSYNLEISAGEFRPVDLAREPFNLQISDFRVYGDDWAYDPRWPKILAKLLRMRVWPGRKHIQIVRGRVERAV